MKATTVQSCAWHRNQGIVGEHGVLMECMMLSNDGPQLRVMVILFQIGGPRGLSINDLNTAHCELDI